MQDPRPQRQPRNPRSLLDPPAPQAPRAPELPRTHEEFMALVTKRSELKHQLESITDRREELANQLEDADPAARTGLVERIRVLDERSARLEQEILQADDAIATSIAAGVGSPTPGDEETTVPPPMPDDVVSKEVLANALMAEALALVLLSVFFYRSLLRRARARFGRGAPEDPKRLDQLQNSVDAIAVEIERISEGQRYVTKALNEGLQPATGPGGREEVLVPRKGT